LLLPTGSSRQINFIQEYVAVGVKESCSVTGDYNKQIDAFKRLNWI
jgi:hypothetical protein